MNEHPIPVLQRGSWPQPIRLRRGWARAEARTWNDLIPDAALRLVRGGSGFLELCSNRLNELGAPYILSPPLPQSSRRPWESAGFVEFVPLAFMRHDLSEGLPSPDHLVIAPPDHSIADLLHVDHAAFDEFWRFDRFGMAEAIAATAKTKSLVIRGPDGVPVAFAIVGFGHAMSYLQRLAVHPDWQGQRMGRSLIRAAARTAQSAGSRAMMLNTQLDNDAAISLYESEGFVTLPESLAVLRRG
ncbi:MAG: GNAT family N-acetyltransferase [Actinomycetota bacterium]|nr:GNAT family N-acetyltransferase [Actinomycetota bacterium]